MIDRMGRKRPLLALTTMAVGALMILAPATAFAQTIPNVTDSVGSTIDTVTGGGGTSNSSGNTGGGSSDGGGGGGSLGGAVGTVTEPVKETVEKTTGGVGTAVEKTGSGVDKIAPGTPVDTTKKIVSETTKKTADGISGAAEGTIDTVRQTTDAIGGGGVLNPDLTIRNPLKNRDRDGKRSKDDRTGAAQKQKQLTATVKAAMAARHSEREVARAKDSALARLERTRDMKGSAVAAAVTPPPRETLLTQLSDAAVEATKKLAFPLGLALMVGAFLMVQGRIDRKDAKLALAPIDAEQDLLSFQ